MIKIDIKVGDTILTGKWKNKKVVVKSIGTDEYGNPTINGKSILKIRVPKLYMKENKMKHISLKSLITEETYPNYMDGYTKSLNPTHVIKFECDNGKNWVDIYHDSRISMGDTYSYYLILNGYYRMGATVLAKTQDEAVSAIWRSLEPKLKLKNIHPTNISYINPKYKKLKELVNKISLTEAFPSSDKQNAATQKLNKVNPDLYHQISSWIQDGARLDLVLDYSSDQFKNYKDFEKIKPTIVTVYKALSGRNN